MMHVVEVEADGRFLRAIALPYGEEALVIGPGRRGERLAHRERFDGDSITDVGYMFGRPILMSHDQTRPIGRLLSTRSTARGLEVEGELLGSDPELESIRRRVAGGVLASVSVAFVPSPRMDEWHKPDASGLPLVVRRGVTVREVSLVVWPAYDNARVIGIYSRSAAAEARKMASDALIAEMQTVMGSTDQRLARRRRATATGDGA